MRSVSYAPVSESFDQSVKCYKLGSSSRPHPLCQPFFLSEEAEYWYFTRVHGHTMNPYGVTILCSMLD
jgi:hypothetical protein